MIELKIKRINVYSNKVYKRTIKISPLNFYEGMKFFSFRYIKRNFFRIQKDNHFALATCHILNEELIMKILKRNGVDFALTPKLIYFQELSDKVIKRILESQSMLQSTIVLYQKLSTKVIKENPSFFTNSNLVSDLIKYQDLDLEILNIIINEYKRNNYILKDIITYQNLSKIDLEKLDLLDFYFENFPYNNFTNYDEITIKEKLQDDFPKFEYYKDYFTCILIVDNMTALFQIKEREVSNNLKVGKTYNTRIKNNYDKVNCFISDSFNINKQVKDRLYGVEDCYNFFVIKVYYKDCTGIVDNYPNFTKFSVINNYSI